MPAVKQSAQNIAQGNDCEHRDDEKYEPEEERVGGYGGGVGGRGGEIDGERDVEMEEHKF